MSEPGIPIKQNWKKIWNSRVLNEINSTSSITDTCQNLLKLDGFDSKTGKIEPQAWLSFIDTIKRDNNINKTDSLYEVGCGAGAFLYPFYVGGNEIGGLDYSEKLISYCKSLFQGHDFQVNEAINLNTDIKYDYVIAFSVFFYFPDLHYSTEVLKKMYKKARKAILILDVPNIKTKEECEVMRRGTMGIEEYKKKYHGLSHLYYDSSYFKEIANRINAKNIKIDPQNIKDYVNNKYRFNCVIYK